MRRYDRFWRTGGRCALEPVDSGRGSLESDSWFDAVCGRPKRPGTKVTFNAKLGLTNVDVEESYLETEVTGYGTEGSVRLDVVIKDGNGKITEIWDLKTGKSGLTPERIKTIRGHLPADCQDVPIRELRPN